MENNAGDCIRIEWEAGYYLGKESWSAGRVRQFGESVVFYESKIARDSEAGIWAGEQEDRQADR